MVLCQPKPPDCARVCRLSGLSSVAETHAVVAKLTTKKDFILDLHKPSRQIGRDRISEPGFGMVMFLNRTLDY